MMLIIALLGLVSLLLIWQFVGYPLLMGIVASLSKRNGKDYNYTPFVSIVVPAYNEEPVIGRRIRNLLALDYPKDRYEIIVVESGSTDNTQEVVQEAMQSHKTSMPKLSLLCEEERRGKASAINAGKSHASGAIVLVTDANSVFDRNVLREMMPHFQDASVGGVGGRLMVSNPDGALASSESFYWDVEYIMRRGESALDSACTFHGEINAWRKALATADPRNLAEDLDIAIQIRRAGYKVEYEPDAIVYEPAAATASDQIRQRKRTSIGTLQCIFKHRRYLLLPRDLYSLLIFPSHKGLTMLSPFLLLAIPILYLIAWDLGIMITHLALTLLGFAALLGAFLFLRARLTDRTEQGTGISMASLPKIIYYVLLNEYLVLLAWRDFLLGRYSVLWDKAESTRR